MLMCALLFVFRPKAVCEHQRASFGKVIRNDGQQRGLTEHRFFPFIASVESTMKHSLLIVASLAALSLGGCKKEEAAAPDAAIATESTQPAEAAPAAAATNPDQAFANAAAASDAFEIQSSQLAAEKAVSSKVKTFAAQMIKAHTDSTAKLKSAAGGATPPITPVPEMTPMQQQTLAALGAKSGAEFDKAYIQAQAEAHQMTLDQLRAYSANGAVPTLKSFATGLVPVVTAHLNMVKGL
jgi:putative membrane protein